jgi:hypothetical protein
MADDVSRIRYLDVPLESIASVSSGAFMVTVKAGLKHDKAKGFVVDGATDIQISGHISAAKDISSAVKKGDLLSAEVSVDTGQCLIFRSDPPNPADLPLWKGDIHYVDDLYDQGITDGSSATLIVLSGPGKDVPQTFRVTAAATITIGGNAKLPQDIPALLTKGDKVTAVLNDAKCTSFKSG